MSTHTLPEQHRGQATTHPAALVAIGAVCGLAWACELRGFMAQVAGRDSEVTWLGTFGWILLPGVITGGLLAYAEHLRRTGGRRHWRWLALSPLALCALFFSDPLNMGTFITSGIGGAALGVALAGIAGGYALSGRGPLWSRLTCALLPLSFIPSWSLTAGGSGAFSLALTTPRGAWAALSLWSSVAVLALGCSIPHRPVVTP
jgi:hypothetical protein